jgi:cytochrome P450
MSDLLTNDDPLYAELYDVRREAEAMGNYIDRDPNAEIAALRAQAPIHAGALRDLLGLPHHRRHPLAEGKPKYCALSYAACEAVLRDSVRFSSSIIHHPNPENEKKLGLLEMDGKEHRGYRRALQPIFLKHQADTWWREQWIDVSVDTLVAGLKERDRADLNLDFCARIPVHTITTAIGLAGEDALNFRIAWVKSGGLGRISPEEQRDGAETVELMLSALVAARRAKPADDVISRLIAAELALPGEKVRPLNDREVNLNARLMLIAGGGTSWRQMGIALWALLSHPAAMAAVRNDYAVIERAIEESIRWNSNTSLFCRLATADSVVEGVRIPKGAVVEVWLNAANRDPKVWDNPDAFNLNRPPSTHLGFGIGQHRCLGLNVARVEMVAGITALLDAFPYLRLDPDRPSPFITGGLEQRGVSALPVLLG